MCFKLSDDPNTNLIDTDSNEVLLKPLEVFLCNTLSSDSVLNKLHDLDDSPQVCGKVFNNGEPTYFCRDCACDPTCVLCVDCFRRSEHRYHKYKMTISGGGGLCDCGDPEAWKQYPNCELHMPKTDDTNKDERSSYEKAINKLPSDLVERANQLFSFIIQYILDILVIQTDDLPTDFKPA
jgi:E3 ubiquitin-protein ligase UBR2